MLAVVNLPKVAQLVVCGSQGIFWGRLNSHSLSLSWVLSNVSQFQVQKLQSPYPISVWDSSVICDLVSWSPGVFRHHVALLWVSFAVQANLC